MKIFLHVYFISILTLHNCYAQPAHVSFHHYTTENGLSSNLVRHIVQDKYGFIWIGTTDGLNRFDAKSFTVYRYNKNDSTSISNNIINVLATDQAGRIWVATNGGLCYYDYTDDVFHRIDIRKNNHEPTDSRRVHAVSITADNKVAYLTRTELHILDKADSVVTFPVDRVEHGDLGSLFTDKSNRIWIGTNKNRILLLNPDRKNFKSFRVAKSRNSAQGDRTISTVEIYQSGEHELLTGTWYAGLQRVEADGDEVKIISFEDEAEKDDRKWIVTGITKSNDSDSFYWVSHFGNGISLFDNATGRFILHKQHDPNDAKSLCSDFVNTVFTDAAGTLWVGTNEGLDKYDALTNRFAWRMIPEFSQTGTVRRQPADILENRNDSSRQSIWIAVVGGGLFLYNKADDSVKSFHHTNDPHSLISNDVYALFMTTDGKLWIGTREGICIYDEKKNSFSKLIVSNGSPELQSIAAIIEDSKNRFWFASFRNGVYCYDPVTRNCVLYEHHDSLPHSLSDNHVFCIMEDHKGRIWAGTQSNGLSRLDEATASWTHFRHVPGEVNSIPENYIYSLLEDEHNQLWIATENGLGLMNLETGEIKSYSMEDGLCSNDIFSFRKTANNHLWLGTINGLSDFDISNNTFRNYFTTDGLPTNDIGGAFTGMSDGSIYLGAPGGIVFFNPTEIKTNMKIPAVVITSFSIFDKKHPVRRNGIDLMPLKLTFRQSMVTFGFAALNFTNPANNRYAYKLEGFDKDWIYCGNKNSATYTNLDGGEYVFKVKASNNDGVWNESGAQVTVRMASPFWKTSWFYLSIVLLLGIILYSVYKVRIGQLLRLQHIRQRIARDLHDDIGSTLSSISMMSKMAAVNPTAGKEKSSELFSTIGRASSQAMDLMSDIVWSVNPENDKIENVVSRMREYCSEILDASGIAFCIECSDAVQRVLLPMDKRKNFFLIFKEAVNNLAKYSNATQAMIRLTYMNRMLNLIIKDNGKGFKTENTFTGNGLKNMKARALELNAVFEISSGSNEGTGISLSVPL